MGLRAYAHASVPIFFPITIPPIGQGSEFSPINGFTVVYFGPDLALFGLDVTTAKQCEFVFAPGVAIFQKSDPIINAAVCGDSEPTYIVGSDVVIQEEQSDIVPLAIGVDTNPPMTAIISTIVICTGNPETVVGLGVYE